MTKRIIFLRSGVLKAATRGESTKFLLVRGGVGRNGRERLVKL